MNIDLDTKYTFTSRNRIISIVLMVIGVAAIAYGFGSGQITRTWATLLHNNFYFTAIALCGTFFVAVQYIAQAGWAIGFIRVPEAMGRFLLYGGIGMILIFFLGHHELYFWTHPELYDKASPEYDHIMVGKRGFLNMGFFSFRLIAYFVIWVAFTMILRKNSLREDVEGGLTNYKKSIPVAATFIVLFAVTSSTSAWDFLMSIDSRWFSTMFGWYTFAGLFVSGLATMCLIILYLKRKGYLQHIGENHLHDVGKFMFAFSIFWTYLWFSQFMLIWYANLPEEVVYYQVRWENFRTLWAVNLCVNFIAPFLVLMTRDAKRQQAILWVAGVIIFIGHWIDVFMMTQPGIVGRDWHIGFIEIGTMLGYLGLFIYVVLNELSKAALVPKNHPMLVETLRHHI